MSAPSLERTDDMTAKEQVRSLREVALAGAASSAGLRHVIRALDWAAAYVGRGIAEGLYDGCVVPGERALDVIEQVRSALDGQ